MADGHLDALITRNARRLLAQAMVTAELGGVTFSLRDVAREAAIYLYRCDPRDRVKIDNMKRLLASYLAFEHHPDSEEFAAALKLKTAWRLDVLEGFAFALQVRLERLLETDPVAAQAPRTSEELDLMAQRWREQAEHARGVQRSRLLLFIRQLGEAMLQPARLEFIMECVARIYGPSPDEALLELLDERKVPPAGPRRLPGTDGT